MKLCLEFDYDIIKGELDLKKAEETILKYLINRLPVAETIDYIEDWIIQVNRITIKTSDDKTK